MEVEGLRSSGCTMGSRRVPWKLAGQVLLKVRVLSAHNKLMYNMLWKEVNYQRSLTKLEHFLVTEEDVGSNPIAGASDIEVKDNREAKPQIYHNQSISEKVTVQTDTVAMDLYNVRKVRDTC